MPDVKKKYDFAVIATDVVIFTVREDALQVLLIQMHKEPYRNTWAMPGGLIRPNESLDPAAERVLREKAGIEQVGLEQLAAFGDKNRDKFGHVVSVAYFALVRSETVKPMTTDEHRAIRWFPVKVHPRLAYDHAQMLDAAVERLRERLLHSNLAAGLMPETFTLTELQRAYEIILDEELDKRNFRKRILASGLLRSTEVMQSGAPNRPAMLYQFAHKSPQSSREF